MFHISVSVHVCALVCVILCLNVFMHKPQTCTYLKLFLRLLHLFSTGFLGRVLLKTPISTRVVDNGNNEMERPTRRVSDNRRMGSRKDRATSPDRNSHPDWTSHRMSAHAHQTCPVVDHSVQWRLASSILDRFFLVTYFFALAGLATWVSVHVSDR